VNRNPDAGAPATSPAALADRRRDLEIAAALREAAAAVLCKTQADMELRFIFRDVESASAFLHNVNRLVMDDLSAEFLDRQTIRGVPIATRISPPVDEQDG
jgi:hypothetical protein